MSDFAAPPVGRIGRLWVATAAIATAASLASAPAQASSCVEKAIAAKSLDEAAAQIWRVSDVIGFGTVSTVDTPEREQQHVNLLVPLKGAAETYAYAPLRIGRTGWKGPGRYRLAADPDEIIFLALVRTATGYVVPLCHQQLLAKDRNGIIRLLSAMSEPGCRRRGQESRFRAGGISAPPCREQAAKRPGSPFTKTIDRRPLAPRKGRQEQL